MESTELTEDTLSLCALARHFMRYNKINEGRDILQLVRDIEENPSLKSIVRRSRIQYYLAQCYNQGIGVEQNFAKAFELYKRSAEQGHADAQYWMGSYYNTQAEDPTIAEEAQKNYQEAIKWYRLSAKQNNLKSQCNLANLLYQGKGGQKDVIYAFILYKISAEHGHATAQNNLGIIYEKGEGRAISKNVQKAIFWFHKAAYQGSAEGQNNLACCYEEGLGVKANIPKAITWYKKSAKQGHENAIESLERLQGVRQ